MGRSDQLNSRLDAAIDLEVDVGILLAEVLPALRMADEDRNRHPTSATSMGLLQPPP
jgi:hypothetical protein